MEGKPHRFFLFQSGATLGTFVEHRQEERVVWSKSLVVEPNGQCFTSVAPTTVRTTMTDHQAESWSEDNDAATPLVARAMHPCQVHHRLSRFCSQNLLPSLRQSMTFRNTYDKQPSFVRHETTNKYLGASACLDRGTSGSSNPSATTLRRPAPLHVVHWPGEFSHEWCGLQDDDGAVFVRSKDGNARFILAPHRQLFQLCFAAPVRSEGEEHDGEEHDASGVDHVSVVQLVWVRQCPPDLLRVLALAMETAALLLGDSKKDDLEDDLEDDLKDAAQATDTVLLPRTAPSNGGRVNWSCATDDMNDNGRTIASESILLVKGIDRLPLFDRVSVEWTRGATYWLHEEMVGDTEDGGRTFVVGCLLHESNTFMTCESSSIDSIDGIDSHDNGVVIGMEGGEGGEGEGEGEGDLVDDFTRRSSRRSRRRRTPVVRVHRSTNARVMLSANAHMPNEKEAAGVRHMLACLNHCRLTRLKRSGSSISTDKNKNKNKNASIATSPAMVEESCHAENVGTFTSFVDRRLRAIFDDRTIVRIDSSWSTCEIVRTDGQLITCLCDRPSDEEESYVRATLEFGQWTEMTPKERQVRSDEEREYCLRVASEEDRIRRFLYMDGLEKSGMVEVEVVTTEEEKEEKKEEEEKAGRHVVPPVRNVLSCPVLAENPTTWARRTNSAAPTPGRELMERYIANTLSETSKFLRTETARETA